MNWAVFLDRDGTLVPNRRYPTQPRQLEPYPGVRAALKRLQREGARLAVVSNQSAVARGFLDAEGLARMDARLRAIFSPVTFAETYYCPHHPDFTGACKCRKPLPGLVLQGLEETRSAAGRSYLIGDSLEDMEAGRRSGVTTVFVLTGFGRRDYAMVRNSALADKITRNVDTAVTWILEHRQV